MYRRMRRKKIKALWCLYLEFGSKTPRSNYKSKKSPIFGLDWVASHAKQLPGPSSFILFTLLRSLHLLGATCQNINSAVVFFLLSLIQHLTRSFSPPLWKTISVSSTFSLIDPCLFLLFLTRSVLLWAPFPFPVSVRFSIFLIVLKTRNSVRLRCPPQWIPRPPSFIHLSRLVSFVIQQSVFPKQEEEKKH